MKEFIIKRKKLIMIISMITSLLIMGLLGFLILSNKSDNDNQKAQEVHHHNINKTPEAIATSKGTQEKERSEYALKKSGQLFYFFLEDADSPQNPEFSKLLSLFYPVFYHVINREEISNSLNSVPNKEQEELFKENFVPQPFLFSTDYFTNNDPKIIELKKNLWEKYGMNLKKAHDLLDEIYSNLTQEEKNYNYIFCLSSKNISELFELKEELQDSLIKSIHSQISIFFTNHYNLNNKVPKNLFQIKILDDNETKNEEEINNQKKINLSFYSQPNNISNLFLNLVQATEIHSSSTMEINCDFMKKFFDSYKDQQIEWRKKFFEGKKQVLKYDKCFPGVNDKYILVANIVEVEDFFDDTISHLYSSEKHKPLYEKFLYEKFKAEEKLFFEKYPVIPLVVKELNDK